MALGCVGHPCHPCLFPPMCWELTEGETAPSPSLGSTRWGTKNETGY